MKKILSIFVVTLLTMSTFVGCASEELSFYKLHKDMSELTQTKPVHSEGQVSISIDALPEELTGDDLEESEQEVVDDVLALINDNSFVYSMDSDVLNGKINMEFELQAKDGEVTPLLAVVRDKDITYVKLDDYFDYLSNIVATFGTEEDAAAFQEEIDEVLGDLEYLSISDDELVDFYVNMLASSMSEEEADMLKEQFEGALDPEVQSERAQAQYKLLDEIVTKGYKDYSFDKVEKDGHNTYSVTLDADNLGDTAMGFLEYSLDNSQTLIDITKNYIANLSDKEYSMLVGMYSMDMMNKEMVMEAIDGMADELELNESDLREQLEQAVVLYNGMYKAYIEGSSLKISLQEANDIYTRDIELKVQVNDPDTEEVMFGGTMSIDESFEEINTFDVERPTEHVVTMTQLLDQVPKTMSLYVDYDMYTLSNLSNGTLSESGNSRTIIQDGRTYLPLRLIGESFGETVGWDNVENKPYIDQDGTVVYFDEFILDGDVSYVKTRAFEKLGYTVRWDDFSRIVTIEK